MIEAEYGTPRSNLSRHRDGCLSRDVREAQEAEQSATMRSASIERGGTVLGQIRALQQEALGILAAAKAEGKLGIALGAIGRAAECLAMIGKLTGELDERPHVQVLVTSAEWLELRGLIVAALRPYPEARAAVEAALSGNGPGGGLPAAA
jgi:hypothetical protein